MDEEKQSYAEGLPEWHDPLFDEKEPEPHRGDNLPILSAVFGAASLLFACIGKVSAVMAVLAMATGIIAHVQKHPKSKPATAGIIMGIVAGGIQLVFLFMHWFYGAAETEGMMTRRMRMAVTVGAPMLAAAVFLLRGMLLSLASFFPPCLFYAATGYYCPGCGNTRSVRALLHGHVLTAMRNNFTIPFLALLLILLYAETAAGLVRGKKRPLRLLPRNGWFWGIVIGLFFAYYIVRNFVPAIAPIT